jgi:hypothetical protein
LVMHPSSCAWHEAKDIHPERAGAAKVSRADGVKT